MSVIQQLQQKITATNKWDKSITLERNEYLKVGGSTDTNLYYITSGSLKIFIIDEYEEHIIRFGYQDNFIAALDSFIREKPSDLFIQALKKTELNVIKKSQYMQFVQSSPENIAMWSQVLGELIVQQMEREQDILISSPAKRYQRVLARSPQLFQEIPHKYIASYLRMTPETLSRIKKS